jgi:hypothetical protein
MHPDGKTRRASIKAIRAISHQFAQRQTAIRWPEWLHRKQANVHRQSDFNGEDM